MTRRSIFVLPLLTALLATTLGLGAVGTVGANIVGTVDVTGLSSHGGAIVYVQQVQGAFAPSAARMDQQKMEFVPHVLPVTIGTTVTFLNSDSTPHFVFTPDYEKFVLGAERPGEGKDRTFDKCVKFPCVYTVLCPMHAEMEGFVVVLQNPFFAVSDKDGRYTIEHVPEGKYSIGVWHPTLKGRAEPVTVTAGDPIMLDFKLTK